jgi:predicted nucleotidyltransferase
MTRMDAPLVGEALRRRRSDAGLTQRELAARAGVPQPNIAAYESGRRVPAAATAQRLEHALRLHTVSRLRSMKAQIVGAAERRKLSDVRVFGSIARADAGSESDLDLLVHPAPDASVFDLAGFMADIEELLGVDVDVVSDRGTGPVMDRIRAEAVPL